MAHGAGISSTTGTTHTTDGSSMVRRRDYRNTRLTAALKGMEPTACPRRRTTPPAPLAVLEPPRTGTHCTPALSEPLHSVALWQRNPLQSSAITHSNSNRTATPTAPNQPEPTALWCWKTPPSSGHGTGTDAAGTGTRKHTAQQYNTRTRTNWDPPLEQKPALLEAGTHPAPVPDLETTGDDDETNARTSAGTGTHSYDRSAAGTGTHCTTESEPDPTPAPAPETTAPSRRRDGDGTHGAYNRPTRRAHAPDQTRHTTGSRPSTCNSSKLLYTGLLLLCCVFDARLIKCDKVERDKNVYVKTCLFEMVNLCNSFIFV